MTPELILAGLAAVLTAPLASTGPLDERGVALSIHGAEDDAMELLATGPEQARLCLTMESLDMEDQLSGTARMTFRALLQAPRDFQITRAAQEVTGGINSNVSLLELATWVRLLISRVLFTARDDFDNTFGFRFLSQRRYAPQGQQGLRSIDMRFACIIGLDMPDGHPLEVPA